MSFANMRGRMTPQERLRLRADVSDAGRRIYASEPAQPHPQVGAEEGNH